MKAQRFFLSGLLRLQALCPPQSTPSAIVAVGLECLAGSRRYTQGTRAGSGCTAHLQVSTSQRTAALAPVLFWAGRWGMEKATQAASASPPGGSSVSHTRRLSVRRKERLSHYFQDGQFQISHRIFESDD